MHKLGFQSALSDQFFSSPLFSTKYGDKNNFFGKLRGIDEFKKQHWNKPLKTPGLGAVHFSHWLKNFIFVLIAHFVIRLFSCYTFIIDVGDNFLHRAILSQRGKQKAAQGADELSWGSILISFSTYTNTQLMLPAFCFLII